MDFINDLLAWFDELADGVNEIIYDIDYLIDSFIVYIEFSTMYIYASSIAILLLIIIAIATNIRCGKIKKKLDILYLEEYKHHNHKNYENERDENTPYCSNCGRTLDTDADKNFCPYCGTYNDNGTYKIG